ncbi:DUF7666 domain-containing protein [Peptostreptococcus porci]|uniref:DUF7666 domain-containing protein n=1 Tax=Peptostreptococcus porci TaxID=2652282 RepID=UPI003AB993D5
MKGYKAFNKDWTCRGFQYEVGKTFKCDGELKMCHSGFHFCTSLADCFTYYSFNKEKTVIAEVEAIGQVIENESDSKCCTDEIKILKELSWSDVLKGCNVGNWNTGYRNTGNRNTGNWNTGNSNTGDWNVGNWNTGYWNTGNRNTGNWNTGNSNTGDWNAGNRNIGNSNAGNWNTGNSNTGNLNTGSHNAGDWNATDYSNGCFNTIEAKIYLFNRLSSWTMSDWLKSRARHILNLMPGSHERQDWWDRLKDDSKKEVLNLPNFDKEIFKQITGIEVEKWNESKV